MQDLPRKQFEICSQNVLISTHPQPNKLLILPDNMSKSLSKKSSLKNKRPVPTAGLRRRINKDARKAVNSALRNRRPRRLRRFGPRRSRNRNRNFTTKNVPVARTQEWRSTKPNFVTSRDGIRIVHKEYLTTLSPDSSSFSLIAKYPINPGLQVTFPWLNTIANNFESYTINYLRVHYVPRCPTTTSGEVMMLIDYDASDDPPTTKSHVLNSQNAIAIAPYNIRILRSTHEQLNKGYKSRYVTDKIDNPNQDIKTLFAGNILIYSEGVVATISDIFLEYDITLKTPAVKDNEPVDGFIMLSCHAPNTSNSHPLLGNGNLTYAGDEDLLAFEKRGSDYDSVYFKNEGYYLLTFESEFVEGETAPTLTVSSVNGIDGHDYDVMFNSVILNATFYLYSPGSDSTDPNVIPRIDIKMQNQESIVYSILTVNTIKKNNFDSFMYFFNNGQVLPLPWTKPVGLIASLSKEIRARNRRNDNMLKSLQNLCVDDVYDDILNYDFDEVSTEEVSDSYDLENSYYRDFLNVEDYVPPLAPGDHRHKM